MSKKYINISFATIPAHAHNWQNSIEMVPSNKQKSTLKSVQQIKDIKPD
jgi:hypothetical protein